VLPEDVLERVWPGVAVTFEPLGGGITNHNFKVEVGGETFVLRIGGKDTELLGIDRHAEEAASRMAASIGVGPEIVAFVEPEGYLVTRFIEGNPIPLERMRTTELIERVAGALSAIHSASPLPSRFDSHRVVEVYAETAIAHGVQVSDDYGWATSLSVRIEAARGPQPTVPCHNDLLNANFIDGGSSVRIVDWEYAGMGDRFFDLANFSINHEFEAEQDEALLESYFGWARDEDFAALRLMRFMSDFREAMWGVVQQGISELDFDFKGYADEHFARLRATASHPRFEEWLSLVQPSGIS
jgi:thiamine kinase-like enzyme